LAFAGRVRLRTAPREAILALRSAHKLPSRTDGVDQGQRNVSL